MKNYADAEREYPTAAPRAAASVSTASTGISAVNERLDDIISRLRNITDRADGIHARLYGPQPVEDIDMSKFGSGTMDTLLCVEHLLSGIESTLQKI